MSEDLIKREDAIKAIMETCCYCSENKVLTEIRNLPTIEPKRGEWIPCSERLPIKSESYLVTVPIDDDRAYVDALNFHKGKFYECDSEWGDIEHDDVIAWMPLPKPYERSDT